MFLLLSIAIYHQALEKFCRAVEAGCAAFAGAGATGANGGGNGGTGGNGGNGGGDGGGLLAGLCSTEAELNGHGLMGLRPFIMAGSLSPLRIVQAVWRIVKDGTGHGTGQWIGNDHGAGNGTDQDTDQAYKAAAAAVYEHVEQHVLQCEYARYTMGRFVQTKTGSPSSLSSPLSLAGTASNTAIPFSSSSSSFSSSMKLNWKDLVPKLARRELVSHSLDKRIKECFPGDFEEARTKDDLWNAIQRGLRRTGSVAPRLLPYYVRRVVECTPSDPMGALLTAMRLLQVNGLFYIL